MLFPFRSSNETGGTDSCRLGDRKTIGKTSSKNSATIKRPISEYTFPSRKMEGLFLLKEIPRNYHMCKIDLKDAYFAVLFHSSYQKYIRFRWKGNLHQFICLCFGLSSAPRIFTELMKVAISVMEKLNVILTKVLDDILIINQKKNQFKQRAL